MEEGSHGFSPDSGGGYKVREARRFNEMAKRKRIATVNRKLGISISCRVQKPVLKDLDAYRKSLKLSRSAALVKLATDHLGPD
jgi:predicted HAD superfamily phosphohydrolase YqeG